MRLERCLVAFGWARTDAAPLPAIPLGLDSRVGLSLAGMVDCLCGAVTALHARASVKVLCGPARADSGSVGWKQNVYLKARRP
ncbi:hypothetical protein JSE7799_02402 [Jannaschia seosinensis]|uniref:Uncharacterized protein n=1 Tax=Jannaschia seosinensis TaxID=313367 RepID=A0A0M7BE88_9RHOB|nr:hypothetical protein JSE7799_02402 [Jannaschia seosinensis]